MEELGRPLAFSASLGLQWTTTCHESHRSFEIIEEKDRRPDLKLSLET